MPRIPSPAEYVSSDSQYNLTSDAELEPSDGPLFPAWHRARRLNSLSDVALCQKLSQLRAYSAFSQQTAEEQLRTLGENPYFQELRLRQRRRNQELRDGQRPAPPPHEMVESDTVSRTQSGSDSGYGTLSGSDSSYAPVYRCPAPGCGDTFRNLHLFRKHRQRNHPDTSDEEPVARTEVVEYRSLSERVKELRERSLVQAELERVKELRERSLVQAELRLAPDDTRVGHICETEQERADRLFESDSRESAGELPSDAFDSTSDSIPDLNDSGENPNIVRPQKSVRKSLPCISKYNSKHLPKGRLACPHSWCGFVSVCMGDVRKHVAEKHARQGFDYLGYESHVLMQLRKWGLTIATPVTMYASSQGWLTDTDRTYSRVDMMVMDVTSCCVLLEVDENAHRSKNYTLTSELARMVDVNAFLRLKGYDQPIYWIRFNPDGKYFVGDEERTVSQIDREIALKSLIFSMMRPDFVPSGNENIHYMFYSRESEKGPPTILQSTDFPEILKSIVSWGE